MGFRDEVTNPQEMGMLGLSEYAVGLGGPLAAEPTD